jgi:hypothetical protein
MCGRKCVPDCPREFAVPFEAVCCHEDKIHPTDRPEGLGVRGIARLDWDVSFTELLGQASVGGEHLGRTAALGERFDELLAKR